MSIISKEIYYQVRSHRFKVDVDGAKYYDESLAKQRVAKMDPTYQAYYIKVTIIRESVG